MTDRGRTVLFGTVFVLMATLIVPAFGVLAALVCLQATALVVGFVFRPRVRTEGHMPDRLLAGQTSAVRYVVENVSRLPVYDLRVCLGPCDNIELVGGLAAIPHLRSGESKEVTLQIRPRRRGRTNVSDPLCYSTFPFNLFRLSARTRTPRAIVVLPAFHPLEVLTRHSLRQVQTIGTRTAGYRGTSPEYIGTRPFMSGDSPRRIDARAWARLGSPVVKEYHDDFRSTVALVLGTQATLSARRSPSEEVPELEAGITLCMSLACALRRDSRIEVFAAGERVHDFAQQPQADRINRIHEILAEIEPASEGRIDWPAALIDRFQGVSEAFFVLPGPYGSYTSLMEHADKAGCHVTALCIGDKADSDPRSLDLMADVIRLTVEQIRTGQVRRL